jgi:pimeloyl-ACP methyl ester carboxylesterase
VITAVLRRAVGAVVVLPGTGSDEVFVEAVFGGPVAAAGLRLVAPPPRHGAELAECHLAALDAAADRHGRIVVGGISLGAHLAAEWAASRPERCAGLLAALPGWCGDAGTAPAGLAAAASADAVDALGVAGALADAVRGVPSWLADELDRAWRRAGDGLAESLRVAAHRAAPTPRLLRTITVPAGVAGCVDDPVHPVDVAARWAESLPDAQLRTITFAEFGADRAALGRAALGGLLARVADEVGDDHADHDGGGDAAQRQR